MSDLISRQALCEYALNQKNKSVTPNDIMRFQSAQPTLYGYNIEHLELIARVLQKENLPPERIVEALTDIGRIVAIVKDEFEETLRKAVEQCTLKPDTDLERLSSGVWDAKEVQTTQPDKIEVHLQEPHALMIKEFIVKETTYPMGTKKETVGELIRCKYCKHRPTLDEDGEPNFPTYRYPCQCEDSYYSWIPKDDWFCGSAERREK